MRMQRFRDVKQKPNDLLLRAEAAVAMMLPMARSILETLILNRHCRHQRQLHLLLRHLPLR